MDKKGVLRDLFQAGVEAVMPQQFVPQNLSLEGDRLRIQDACYDLRDYSDIYLLGSGKASIEMAQEVQKILGERIKKALVVSNQSRSIEGIEVLESSHPVPSQKSLDAADRVIELLQSMEEGDLFIYLLSGGSSALIEKPIEGVDLEAWISLSQMMLGSGMPIEEMNVIRKRLSQIKGGGLGQFTKAEGVVLVLSDVIGDRRDTIGSAPFYADAKEGEDAQALLKRYGLWEKLPQAVVDALERSTSQPKKAFHPTPHYIVASNRIALQAIKQNAQNMGLCCEIVTDTLVGDVKEVAKRITAERVASECDLLLFGGESTVVLQGKGHGGRNQELALWVLKEIKAQGGGWCFLSAGSDGIDGNSDAAGAVVGIEDWDSSIDSYLADNDSNRYLQKHHVVIKIGKTGTNVMDIMMALKE